MSRNNVPVYVRASEALATGREYSGTVSVAQLPRLAAAVEVQDSTLTVAIKALRDAQRRDWLEGSMEGSLMLHCQRGLHPYAWQCQHAFKLRLVGSEAEERKVLQECEPLLVQEDRLMLRDVIEDEVLLLLPMTPRCGDEGCVSRLQQA